MTYSHIIGAWQVFLHWCEHCGIDYDSKLFGFTFYSPKINRQLQEVGINFTTPVPLQETPPQLAAVVAAKGCVPRPPLQLPLLASSYQSAGAAHHWFR